MQSRTRKGGGHHQNHSGLSKQEAQLIGIKVDTEQRLAIKVDTEQRLASALPLAAAAALPPSGDFLEKDLLCLFER